jgi:hypothetical protein
MRAQLAVHTSQRIVTIPREKAAAAIGGGGALHILIELGFTVRYLG